MEQLDIFYISNGKKWGEVRAIFFNAPNVDAFINKRVAKYIGKTAKSKDTSLPKKFLAAWINKVRKIGGP